ncbi:MAG: T9SS type A sorting domain-containing protein [Bacteroidetes bacterium]|nr:MAG: T9SS type A sorting domain-containing protein [Bacteroidota bacterium]
MIPVRPATVLPFLFQKVCYLFLLQVMVFGFFFASAQTNISGVVNSYYKVVEVIPAKACVRLNTVAGLARLQKTLLIQMKGASVITTNNSSFGDTTSLNNAGNYERAIICSINGDSVFMFHNFLNSYTVTDKVQLVKFAEYYSANVIDTIKASPWNNTNGTGGVIAISVSQDLTLNAPVYADSSGFRGGGYLLSNGTCFNVPFAATNYFYNASSTAPQNGSYKGESVYDFPLAQSGGRGAPANGGGGGNNHNNGGAGGANLAAGGKGGGNSSSAGCTTDLHADGGKALKNWNGTKLFFGGAGGAGHSNGTLTISNGGGNGGGLIFIEAETLIGNGYKISANGGAGGTAVSDGASGGGAAGSVVMDITSYSGSVTLQANGGKGGDEDDAGTTQRCYGAGGGGSGGVIYFTGSAPAVTISVTGGPAGLEYSRDPGCNATIPAAAGSNGTTISSYVIRQSTDSATYCLSIPLAVKLIYFKAARNESNIQLRWAVSNPEIAQEFVLEKNMANSWSPLYSALADSLKNNYSYTDDHPEQGINLYRLRVIEKNNVFFYSPVRQVNGNQKNDRFVLYPNPASEQVFITGNFSSLTEIKLFDLSGTIRWHKKIVNSNGSTAVDLSSFESGVYELQINNVIKRLVIRK